MFISAETKLYGIFGYPLKHTLSPKLHSEMFIQNHINAVYLAFETENHNNIADCMKSLNINGANITIPYKEKVIDYLDWIDVDAQNIGAVNTIKNVKGKLYGYNTDYLGFMYMVKNNINLYKEKKFTVLGAGGAAKAIVYALYKLGIKHINLLNRSKKNADNLKKSMEKFIDMDIGSLNDKTILKSSNVIINCTSVGLKDDSLPIDINYIDKAEVLDIIYKDSALIKKAKQKGLNAINGLDMFIEQAFYSFKIWTEIEFDRKKAYKILKG